MRFKTFALLDEAKIERMPNGTRVFENPNDRQIISIIKSSKSTHGAARLIYDTRTGKYWAWDASAYIHAEVISYLFGISENDAWKLLDVIVIPMGIEFDDYGKKKYQLWIRNRNPEKVPSRIIKTINKVIEKLNATIKEDVLFEGKRLGYIKQDMTQGLVMEMPTASDLYSMFQKATGAMNIRIIYDFKKDKWWSVFSNKYIHSDIGKIVWPTLSLSSIVQKIYGNELTGFLRIVIEKTSDNKIWYYSDDGFASLGDDLGFFRSKFKKTLLRFYKRVDQQKEIALLSEMTKLPRFSHFVQEAKAIEIDPYEFMGKLFVKGDVFTKQEFMQYFATYGIFKHHHTTLMKAIKNGRVEELGGSEFRFVK